MNSYFNQSDFNPGGKYGPDAEAMQDRIDQASPFNVANKTFEPKYSSRDKAIEKSLSWLAGRDKYRSQAERQQGGVGFMPRSGGGGGGQFQQVAPDISVWMPPQDQPFTVQAPQSGGGGLGSTIGGLVGIGGQALGVFGPLGYAAGTLAGKAADEFKLFG